MELILKTDNLNKIAKVIAFAKELNIAVEQRDSIKSEKEQRENLKQRILNFKANSPSSFSDAANWEKEQRNDRDLPFPNN